MKPRCRYFTFSLRIFFVLLTIGCLWLGWRANRAHEQRQAAKAIKSLRGVVFYERQLSWTADEWQIKAPVPPGGPGWLRAFIGDEFFQEIAMVVVDERASHPPPTKADLFKVVQRLKRLPRLRRFYAWFLLDVRTQAEIKATLHGCEVIFPRPDEWTVPPVTEQVSQ